MLNSLFNWGIFASPGLIVIYLCVACSLFCQIIKFIYMSIVKKQLYWQAFSIAGGFPSSHTAVVTCLDVSLFVYQIKTNQNIDFLFSVALIFTIIVVYDAMSVRYESGKHAKVLNRLIEKLSEEDKKELKEKDLYPLTESLGHRMREVLAGVAVGVLFGFFTFLAL